MARGREIEIEVKRERGRGRVMHVHTSSFFLLFILLSPLLVFEPDTLARSVEGIEFRLWTRLDCIAVVAVVVQLKWETWMGSSVVACSVVEYMLKGICNQTLNGILLYSKSLVCVKG